MTAGRRPIEHDIGMFFSCGRCARASTQTPPSNPSERFTMFPKRSVSASESFQKASISFRLFPKISQASETYQELTAESRESAGSWRCHARRCGHPETHGWRRMRKAVRSAPRLWIPAFAGVTAVVLGVARASDLRAGSGRVGGERTRAFSIENIIRTKRLFVKRLFGLEPFLVSSADRQEGAGLASSPRPAGIDPVRSFRLRWYERRMP